MFKFLIAAFLVGTPLAVMAQRSPLQVTRAEWGANGNWTDVTRRVQAIVDSGAANFNVDVNALGKDPLPGSPKMLRVQIRRQGGQAQSFEYRDFDTVDLRSWGVATGAQELRSADPRERTRTVVGRGDLLILSAQYGDGQRQNDVTTILNNAIQGGNTLSIQAANQNMGGDPATGVVKRLTVQYQWQRQIYNVTIPENGWLQLPGNGSPNGMATTGLSIVQATYGEGARVADVTSRLQSMVQADRLTIRASNDAMGGDPARGADKKLTVVYDWQGTRFQARANEDSTLMLPRPGDENMGPAATSPFGGGASTMTRGINAGRYFDPAEQIWKMDGDGVCFYRQPNFKGEALCVQSGQQFAGTGRNDNDPYLSVRFFGRARQVQVWNQPNFGGRDGRLTRDETDLRRSRTGGSLMAIGSARVN